MTPTQKKSRAGFPAPHFIETDRPSLTYFLASNLALHFSQQNATVFPSLFLLVMVESAGFPLMGHLSVAEANPADANVRMKTVNSDFMS
jgi:hypothetical protein